MCVCLSVCGSMYVCVYSFVVLLFDLCKYLNRHRGIGSVPLVVTQFVYRCVCLHWCVYVCVYTYCIIDHSGHAELHYNTEAIYKKESRPL